MSMASSTQQTIAPSPAQRSPRPWIGAVVVLVALACALTTFLVMAEFRPLAPTSDLLMALYCADGVALVGLVWMVASQSWNLFKAWRSGAAAARLHMRAVAFFAVVALVPAVVLAVVGSISLDRALNPVFMANVRGFVDSTAEVAENQLKRQCGELLREAELTAADLDDANGLYITDSAGFHRFFAKRAGVMNFAAAALVAPGGQILERVESPQTAASVIVDLPPSEFDDARKKEDKCAYLDDLDAYVALRPLNTLPNTFLYVTRPIDPFAVEFPKQAQILISNYDQFESFGVAVKRTFATMYALLTTIMLLSAVSVGLDFANRLVDPIRALITATDRVSAGDLDVRVEVDRSHGDLASLGEGFNKMTTELDLQQKRLRAVLAGVPAAVIGLDAAGGINVVNRSAEALLRPSGEGLTPQRADAALPELAPILKEAADVFPRAIQTHLTIKRSGAERTYNVRVTSAQAADGRPNFVVTLDDITDLMMAQRSSAWAEIARRIAHEIKNPLTPIQLSAERLKRKYGRLIEVDRDVFDQCIDTIVRQVDDIKRMVDEFSSFARMPKARLQKDDLCECVRQVAFMMRVGNTDVDIVEELPQAALMALFDRRLLSQALQNLVKNAIEGIAAREGSGELEKGKVQIVLRTRDASAEIDVIDNGKGFPEANRHLLLEPYMTTRVDGTGLGLPIVAKIIEDHGGKLELLDTPAGPGACVRLLLPLSPEASRE